MHTPYEERLKHKADFRVKYRFYTQEEGGRQVIPFQGYRSDFWYFNEEHKPNEVFMIWPEFEDKSGEVILENCKGVDKEGTARMWIIIPERREYHRNKIVIGTKGYFKEGGRSTGDCEVIEIIGLHMNPTKSK